MVLELFWQILHIILYALLGLFMFLSPINILTALFSMKREKKYDVITPRVSAIVRTWNDGSVVERCIQSYLNQEYPQKELEIIIADDGSEDNTKEICEYYAKRGCIKYVRLPEHHEYKADVIDYVVKNFVTGEIILETDVDAVLPKNWVKEMVKPFSDPEVGGVTGTVMCGNWYRGSIARIRAIEDFWHFCTCLYGRFAISGTGLLYGGCKGYRKSAWLKVGGHSKKTLVEDAEFALKLIDEGYKIVIIKAAPIMQEEVETFPQYMSEQKRWVSGDLSVNKIFGKSLRENKLNYLLMLANFGMDAILLLSFVLLPYQLLFILPILMSLVALYIGMWTVKARGIFFLFAPIYLWVGPLLRTTVILALAKQKILRQPVTWTKVWHYSTPLKWPTYS